MPWSNQGGGGGKGGGGNGGGPGAKGPGARAAAAAQPPDLDEILRRGQDKVKQVMRGGGGGPGGGGGEGGVPQPFLFFLGIIARRSRRFYGFTFHVNPDEQGIVLRFGKFDRWEGPGLHFRLPYPIEEVRLPQVTQQTTIEVGMRPLERARRRAGWPDSGLMLTGDGSVVDVRFVVFGASRRKPIPPPGRRASSSICSTSPSRRSRCARSPKAPCARSSARSTCSRC